jgi:nucleoside-diphosphate-sugar epimerase
MKVVVTGGSGKAGSAVVRDLREHGHDVLSVDVNPPRDGVGPAQIVDVREFGQTIECLAGADAVVHLAAIPAPGFFTEETTFRTNITSTFNVFEAARVLDLDRVVWASSETVFGFPFDKPPLYTPFDEESPDRPESSYALAKLLGEQMGEQFSRRTGTPHVALRFSNIMEVHDYAGFPDFWGDASKRKWNLWGYVDIRDVAQSCRLALEVEIDGAEVFAIAAADTVMSRPSAELVAEVFGDVEHRATGGEYDSLLSTAKAQRLLGYEPQHSWRDHIAAP